MAPAGGGVHHARDAVRLRGAENVNRPLEVDPCVVRRVRNGLAHVDLGGEMEDHVGLGAAHGVAHSLGVADVDLLERGSAGQRVLEVFALAGGEVVDDDDLIPAREESVHEVRADESGAARYECVHEAATLGHPNLGVLDLEVG